MPPIEVTRPPAICATWGSAGGELYHHGLRGVVVWRWRDDSVFAPADQITALHDSAQHSGADPTVFTYPGCKHFFTDAESPDYDPLVADRAWRRVRELLATLPDAPPPGPATHVVPPLDR